LALTTRDGYIAAAASSQEVGFGKTAARTSVAATWFSIFDLAGNPGAGTLAGSNTANGVVPTDATAGCPTINVFSGSNRGYIETVDFGNTVAARHRLYDLLFKAGAYSFNQSGSLTSQPSFSSRVSLNGGSPDYKGLQIWIEAVTAFTGNPTINVFYTNQDGVANRQTGAVAFGVAPTVGRLTQMPLAPGDTGVQRIDGVVATVASVGTFNVLIGRRLWSGRSRLANDGDTHGPDKTGLVEVFADSAFYVMVAADSTSTGIPELSIGVANG
jgi:hypothetical protein